MSKVAKLEIKYHENSTDSDIKKIITELYYKNKEIISGMEYSEYNSEEDYKKDNNVKKLSLQEYSDIDIKLSEVERKLQFTELDQESLLVNHLRSYLHSVFERKR